MKNKNIKIYSIGAGDENHGPALPKNIDDFVAKRTAALVAETVFADYRGHLPYSGDRVGEVARAWSKCYMDRNEVIGGLISYIKTDCKILSSLKDKTCGVVVISGHGGNNFIEDETKRISSRLKVPFLYVPPFLGVEYIQTKKYGEIVSCHADDAEHSVALYLNLLDKKRFRMLNALAKKNPFEVLEIWPELMGLGGYMLLQRKEDECSKSRRLALEKVGLDSLLAEKFLERKKIIADKKVGKEFFERGLENSVIITGRFIDGIKI